MIFFEPLKHRNADQLTRVAMTPTIVNDITAIQTVARIGQFLPEELGQFLTKGKGVACYETGIWPGDEEEPRLIGFCLYMPRYKPKVYEITRVWGHPEYGTLIGLELIKRVVAVAKEEEYSCRAEVVGEELARLFVAASWTQIDQRPSPTPSGSPSFRFVFPTPSPTTVRAYQMEQMATR